MKLGRLPRGLAVAAISAVTVVPLAASAAAAAPAPPTAYALYGSAEPLYWGSTPAVGELRVPFVTGKTNNLAVGTSSALLALPNGDTTRPMSGEAIAGLTCKGFDEKACKDPFFPLADVGHRGVDPGHSEQAAFFGGREGKFPGHISAVTHCDGNCGDQLIKSTSDALGPAGGYSGYLSVGSSAASHDLSIDDKGRLVSTARSVLENVAIGPNAEVRFSRLETIAHAFGTGAENAKDGRAEIKITDFFILDNRVELTRAGLRLANGGPSEQEAYDGAKHLLSRLRRDHGIVLEAPNFDAQLIKSPAHAAVESRGLRVRFEQSVGSVNAGAISSPLELGRSTAVVAALDTDRNIEVKENPGGGVTVETTAPTAAPVAAPGGTGPAGPSVPKTDRPGSTGSTSKSGSSSATGGVKPTKPPASSPNGTATPAPSGPADPSPVVTPGPASPAEVGAQPPALENPEETALPSVDDLQRNLGLKGARSVSRAFGAFLGLGLILPLARFVIRRLG